MMGLFFKLACLFLENNLVVTDFGSGYLGPTARLKYFAQVFIGN